jgi:hypothetical protein
MVISSRNAWKRDWNSHCTVAKRDLLTAIRGYPPQNPIVESESVFGCGVCAKQSKAKQEMNFDSHCMELFNRFRSIFSQISAISSRIFSSKNKEQLKAINICLKRIAKYFAYIFVWRY